MKKTAKKLVRDWLPPVLLRQLVRARGIGNRFEGDYTQWSEAQSHCGGYGAKQILEKVLAAALKVKSGEAVYERDSVVFDQVEYFWQVTSALMWVAARDQGRLDVLDFGGSLGTSFFQNRKFLQELPEVSWNIVEQEHYVEAGRQYIQSGELRFYNTIEECLANSRPNVILVSGVLQYLEEPVGVLNDLAAANATCLIIDRTPLSNLDGDKILIQKVPKSIYDASYPMWVFSKTRLQHVLEGQWQPIVDWNNSEGSVVSTSGLSFMFQGMLLEARR